MTKDKNHSAIFTCILGLIVFLALGTYYVHAADPIITTALDDIGFKYTLDKDGDVWLSYDVEGKNISFYIKKISDDNTLMFTFIIKESGVVALQCMVGADCRGDALQSAISAFIHSVAKFKDLQATYAKKLGLPDTTSASSATTGPSITDFNAIPAQYRTSESQIAAWLKQNGLFGKPISVKATLVSISEYFVMVTFVYNDPPDPISAPMIVVSPIKFSPLDYTKGETYIVTGTPVTDDMGSLVFRNSTLQIAK